MRDVRVCDATMKRANDADGVSLSFKEKLELAKLLNRMGAAVVEVEGVSNPKVDSLRIKSLASIVTEAVLAVPVALDVGDLDLIGDALAEAAHPRLQVMASVSPAQMEYLYHQKAPQMLDAIGRAVGAARAKTADVEFIARDATRADADYLAQAIERAIEAGASTVTVYDEAGRMLPEQFARFVSGLFAAVPALSGVDVGISCSDALSLADACTVAGIGAGATEVKGTSYPLGMASVPNLAAILSVRGEDLGVRSRLRTTELARITAQVARICGEGPKGNAVIASMASEDGSIELSAADGQDDVTAAAAALGYDLSPEDALAVYEAFGRIAAKKGTVGARELDAIVASAAMQVPAAYTVDDYVVNSGNLIGATARVRMVRDGEPLEAVCMGDGPIDAAFMAIEEVVGRHFELDDFQIQAVTEGQEAMGQTVVKLVSGGKLYSGRGISTDIVGSSIRAFVNAVNKAVYEEQGR